MQVVVSRTDNDEYCAEDYDVMPLLKTLLEKAWQKPRKFTKEGSEGEPWFPLKEGFKGNFGSLWNIVIFFYIKYI